MGHEVGDYVMYALGFGVGAALWYVLLLRTVSHFRAQFSPTVMPLLDSVAGGVLLLCAGLLTYSCNGLQSKPAGTAISAFSGPH